MKAVCWHGAQDMRVDNVADPQILNPRDAIIKVTSTAICGSDLHLYGGFMPGMQAGDIVGHEFMGEVVRSDGSPLPHAILKKVDLIDPNHAVRHDSEKLAEAIVSIYREGRRTGKARTKPAGRS